MNDVNVAVAARTAFAAWVSEAGEEGRTFAEVRIRRTENGYAVRNAEDDDSDAVTKVYSAPRAAREVSRLTESGDYRPLKSSPNLRRGWRLELSGDRDLVSAMNYLYPAAVSHWYLEREGRLQTTDFRENAERQSGMYARVKHLTDEAVQNAATACCSDAVCLKRPLWDVDGDTPLEMERGTGEIPCPEPCSVFVAFGRKVRSFEKEEVYRDDDPNSLTPSEKEDVRALIEAVASGDATLAREAEFDEPLNVRRMRYRRLTLSVGLEQSGD